MVLSPERVAHYKKLGLSNMKELVFQWSGQQQIEAREWIAQEEAEQRAQEGAHRLEQIDIARSAAAEAASANTLAREANSIARDAADSAAESARAAKTNNVIATLALIAAAIAMAISIVGIFIR